MSRLIYLNVFPLCNQNSRQKRDRRIVRQTIIHQVDHFSELADVVYLFSFLSVPVFVNNDVLSRFPNFYHLFFKEKINSFFLVFLNWIKFQKIKVCFKPCSAKRRFWWLDRENLSEHPNVFIWLPQFLFKRPNLYFYQYCVHDHFQWLISYKLDAYRRLLGLLLMI